MGSLGNQTFIGTNLHPDVIRRLDDLVGHLSQTKTDLATTTANQVTPAQVETIATGAVAKALLGPLNISNALGTAATAQKALIPIVKALPNPVTTPLQVGQAVVFDNDIWVWSGTAWILAVQWTFQDTHANRLANFPPGKYVLGTWFYETDRTVWYTNDGTFGSSNWIYKLGTMRATLSPDLRPTGLGGNDTGFQFFATDWGVTYRWSGAAWIYQTGVYVAATGSRPATLGTNDTDFLFIDSTLKILELWNGSAWVIIGSVSTLSPSFRAFSGASDSLLTTDFTVESTNSGAAVENLLDATTCVDQMFAIKNSVTSTNALTVTPHGGQLIDGSGGIILQPTEGILIQSDGANWIVLSATRLSLSGLCLQGLSNGTFMSLTSTYQNVVGAAVTLNRVGLWLVQGILDYTGGITPANCFGQLLVAGSPFGDNIPVMFVDFSNLSGTQSWLVTAASPSVACQLQAKTTITSGGATAGVNQAPGASSLTATWIHS